MNEDKPNPRYMFEGVPFALQPRALSEAQAMEFAKLYIAYGQVFVRYDANGAHVISPRDVYEDPPVDPNKRDWMCRRCTAGPFTRAELEQHWRDAGEGHGASIRR